MSWMLCCATGKRSAGGIEERVEAARTAMDDARLAAQQVRVRRETVAEQLSVVGFEFGRLDRAARPRASVATWESELEETKSKIERLGQVNLAAIGEFKEQSGAQGISRPSMQGLDRCVGDFGIGDAQE